MPEPSKSKSTGKKKRGGKRKEGERKIICEIPWEKIPPVKNPVPLPAWFTEEVARKPESEKISTCPVCSGNGSYSNLKEWCASCIGIRCRPIEGLEVFGDPLCRTPVYSNDRAVDCTHKTYCQIERNPDIWLRVPDYTIRVYSSDESSTGGSDTEVDSCDQEAKINLKEPEWDELSSTGSSDTEVDCRDQEAKIIFKEPECFERGVRLGEVW